MGYAAYQGLKGKPLLVVFTFHRITDSNHSHGFYMNYEKGLDSVHFEAQIAGICKYFRPIGLDHFIRYVSGQASIKDHSALITFDDADSDFAQYALPILKKYRCPSVMFAPTAFIDTDRRFWHLRVSNIIRKLTPESWKKIQQQGPQLPKSVREIVKAPFPEDDKRKAALALTLNYRFNDENIDEVLKHIECWETFVGREFVLDIKCMGWNWLRALESDSVYIESHTVNHGKLAHIGQPEIEYELVESKAHIERELSKQVKAISYPGGSYNEDVLRIARTAGYQIGFTTEFGICRYPLRGDDLFKLPRFSLYGTDSAEINYVLGQIALKSIIGRKL